MFRENANNGMVRNVRLVRLPTRGRVPAPLHDHPTEKAMTRSHSMAAIVTASLSAALFVVNCAATQTQEFESEHLRYRVLARGPRPLTRLTSEVAGKSRYPTMASGVPWPSIVRLA
jgi:hypothetical protein